MTYNYKETHNEIIVDKGIATREMWKVYPHGREHVSYEELCKALTIRDKVPLVLDTEVDHRYPLTDAGKAIGSAHFRPCPDKRGLTATWRFHKSKLPTWLMAKLRRRESLPVSIFQFADVQQGEQQNLLFDHIAILQDSTPRCPPTQCGVGVYDAMNEEEEQKKKKQPEPLLEEVEGTVSEPVPEEQPENQKTTEETVLVEAREPDAVPETETLKTQISELQKELDTKEAELASEREPLIGLLLQRGISRDAAEAMSLQDLRTTASALREQQTQGLPGTVPAPKSAPKTYEEAKDESYQKFHEALDKKTKKEFENW